jgi:uncharacterized protein YbaR (Trm112 family)
VCCVFCLLSGCHNQQSRIRSHFLLALGAPSQVHMMASSPVVCPNCSHELRLRKVGRLPGTQAPTTPEGLLLRPWPPSSSTELAPFQVQLADLVCCPNCSHELRLTTCIGTVPRTPDRIQLPTTPEGLLPPPLSSAGLPHRVVCQPQSLRGIYRCYKTYSTLIMAMLLTLPMLGFS